MSEPRNLPWWRKRLYLPLCAAIHRWVLGSSGQKGCPVLSFQTSESQRWGLWGQWCCPEESLPDHLSCPHCLGRPLWENTVVGILVCLYFLGFEKNCLIIHVLNWYIADGLVIIWMDCMAFALGLSFANTTATTYRSFTICQTLYIFWSICSSAHGNSIE